jgi:hypothetical protein
LTEGKGLTHGGREVERHLPPHWLGASRRERGIRGRITEPRAASYQLTCDGSTQVWLSTSPDDGGFGVQMPGRRR